MKYLLFLLFPFFLQAQNALPDTIVVKNNKVFPCFITNISGDKVEFDFPGSGPSMLVLDAVSRIVVAENGEVFISDKRFIKDQEEVAKFVSNRNNEKILIEQKEQQKQQQQQVEQEPEIVTRLPKGKAVCNMGAAEPEKRWSFGVLLIPYYSGRIYNYVRNSDGSSGTLITSINNEINMEGQFAYKLSHNVSFTFDVSYTSAYTDNKYESHYRQGEPSYNYDQGYQDSDDLKLIEINIGAKYYLTNYEQDFVNAYLLAGIGKQFAIADISYKNLYPQPPSQYTYEDNQEEYIEDMNSPWNLNFGFGAEYMFNKSLSVYSVIRFYYSKINAEYKSRQITTTQTPSTQINTTSREYTKSDFITRIGVGLNFYF